jgi:hypothetical protein
MRYDNPVARRRQLSSRPLGGDCLQSLVAFIVPNRYVCFRSIGVQRENLLHSCYKILHVLPFYNLSIGEKMFNETSVSGEFPTVTNNRARSNLDYFTKYENYFVSNCAHPHLELSPPNHVAQADGKVRSTIWPRAQKFFREVVASAARMHYDDPAVRCRSLAPVR